MLDAIFSRPVKALKLLAKVQCVLAFVLSVMLYGYVYLRFMPVHLSISSSYPR